MREIKFRAWDIKNEIMTLAPMSKVYRNKYSLFGDIYLLEKEAFEDTVRVELMQYTGLKDMNGVEIYEGDVLSKYGHPSRKIIFENGCFVGMSTDVVQALSWKPGKLKSLIELHFKVVGNIYENPELLEGDTK